MRLGIALALLTAAAGAACAPDTKTLTESDYKTSVASSAGYLKSAKDRRSIGISEPWVALSGDMMVCTIDYQPDGQGGFSTQGQYSIYVLNGNRVVQRMNAPDEVSVCRLKGNYTPLPRV